MEPEGSIFEALPTEIILQILTSISDLATLCELVFASPRAYRIFNSHQPASIMETVLCAGNACPQIQFMFRLYALVQSETLPPWSIEEVSKHVFEDPMRIDYRQSTRPPDAFDPGPLAQDLELYIIHDLLIAARDITRLSFDCLATFLRRFRSSTPRQTVGNNLSLGLSASLSRTSISLSPEASTSYAEGLWDGQPETKPVEVLDIGPPTWSEQQRVMRAFWRQQLADDVDSNYFLRNGWELDWNIRFKLFIHRRVSRFKGPRKTGDDCYSSRSSAMYTETMHLPPTEQGQPTSPSPEYDELGSMIEYIDERFGQTAADKLALKITWFREILDDAKLTSYSLIREQQICNQELMSSWLNPVHTLDDERELLQPSPAVSRIFQRTQSSDSPLRCLGIEPFIRYGLAFWCEERLRGYGLLAPKGEEASPSSEARIDWTWISLLSPEEREVAREILLRSSTETTT